MNLKETIQVNSNEFLSLCKSHDVKTLYAFGSSTNDRFKEESSDIDLLVDFEPEKENFDNFLSVYDLLEKVFKNHKIEIVTKNGLSPHIGPFILNEVVYA